MNGSNILKGWIYSHYGSYMDMAVRLEVSVSTVSAWAQTQPRNMLKYLPEISRYTGEKVDAIVCVVQEREKEIYGQA